MNNPKVDDPVWTSDNAYFTKNTVATVRVIVKKVGAFISYLEIYEKIGNRRDKELLEIFRRFLDEVHAVFTNGTSDE